MGRTNYYLTSGKDTSYYVCTEPTFSGLPPQYTSSIAAHKGRMKQESTHLPELKVFIESPLEEVELEDRVSSVCTGSYLMAEIEFFWMIALLSITPAPGNRDHFQQTKSRWQLGCVVKSLHGDMQAVHQDCASGSSVMGT